jgi:hypothetical protein
MQDNYILLCGREGGLWDSRLFRFFSTYPYYEVKLGILVHIQKRYTQILKKGCRKMQDILKAIARREGELE